MPEKRKVGFENSEAELDFSNSKISPIYDDHDYVCSRSSKTVTVGKEHTGRSNVHHGIGGPESKTSSREVNSFWKVGHDTRRKLCVVGFNWNSSQLRLSKLGKSGTPSVVSYGRPKQRDKSSRSKVVLTSCESSSVVKSAMHTVSGASGDRPEVVKGMEQQSGSSTKRRSKVYIYKPRSNAADSPSARPTTAKSVALVSKSTRAKTGSGNTVMSTIDETSVAVESIIPPAEFHETPEVSVPLHGGLQRRAGEYTIQLSSTGPSKPSATTVKNVSPDYDGYLSSLLRETGSGLSAGCEVMSAAAVSLQQIIEGGVQTSSTLSTAPLGIPSPFLLQTGLEQALGFAAFHPMSPSTSSSTCSRVAGDDWPVNEDDDLIGPQTTRRDCDGVSCPAILQASENWISGSTNGRYDEACGSGDAAAFYSTDHGLFPSSQSEQVYFDDFTAPFSSDGDLRYQSSSFVVSDDNWDGYQREEQIVDCWSHHSSSFTATASNFGRKSATSRFRFADTGVIAAFGGGGPSFGRAGGRGDRRRKQPEDKRNRKLLNGAEGDVIVAPGSDGPEAVSASKKCRQRMYGDGSKRSGQSAGSDPTQSEEIANIDNLDTGQKNSSSRRRKQATSSRKKYAAAVENLSSEASDATPKMEGVTKKRAQPKSSRGQLEGSLKTQNSVVR